MIFAYLFYAAAVISFFWITWHFASYDDLVSGILMGICVALCFLLIGGLIHAVVWESRQPAFSLIKAQWSCTASHEEMITTYVKVGDVTVPQTSFQTVCDQYTRR